MKGRGLRRYAVTSGIAITDRRSGAPDGCVNRGIQAVRGPPGGWLPGADPLSKKCLRVAGWQRGQKKTSCPRTPSRRIVDPQRGQGSPRRFLTRSWPRTLTWIGSAASRAAGGKRLRLSIPVLSCRA
jgi:hypothetical protein